MSREDKLLEIACELYNRDHRGQVTPKTFHLLAGFATQGLLRQANEILMEKEKYEDQVTAASLATAEEDRRFIEENPVNGDIDLSPHPLL